MDKPVDPILAAAEARLVELNQDIQKVRDFIASYHSFARIAKADSENTKGTQNSSTEKVRAMENWEQPALLSGEAVERTALDAAPPKRTRVTDNPKPALVVAAALEVIREAGYPLTRREIHAKLAERGIVVRGADEVKALGTMLWRSGSKVLTQVDKRGYWPAGVPVPEVTVEELFG